MKKINEKDKVYAPKFRIMTGQKRGISILQQEPDEPFQFGFSTPVVAVK
jgi:hypothetical protein